jgi:endonuclease/exonuclease/phosphatase family metal-dependent hydrolase
MPIIATLNLWGEFADWPARLELIAAEPRIANIDVLLLQEVVLSETEDQAERAAQRLDYPYRAHCLAETTPHHSEGVAILSRIPFVAVRDLALPRSQPPRRLLIAELQLDRPLTVLTAHTVFNPSNVLDEQLNMIIAQPHTPLVVGGDFNTTPDRVAPLLARHGLRDLHDPMATWPVSEAHFRRGWAGRFGSAPDFAIEARKLDYLLGREVQVQAAGQFAIGDETAGYASDHALLWADVS